MPEPTSSSGAGGAVLVAIGASLVGHRYGALATVAAAALIGAFISLAAGSGAGQMLGWTPDQWAIIGVICGVAIGFIGMVAKVAMDYHFRSQHLKLAQKRAKALETTPGGLE